MEITFQNITKKYSRSLIALNHINACIHPGVTGLLGPNGAGKSTLMSILVGLLPPDQGQILFQNRPLVEQINSFYRSLGYLPQQFTAYPNLTVEEFLDYLAVLKEIDPGKICRERVEQALEAMHLTAYRKRLTRTLSGGLRQRLGIAQALLNDPQILILDEPTSGLDPEERMQFRNLLSSLAVGRTVLISSHIISDLSATCEWLLILEKGHLIYTGSVERLIRQSVGQVWETRLNSNEFSAFQQSHSVISSRRESDFILARVIATEKPGEDSSSVPPTLEDAYGRIRMEKRS